MSLLDELAGFAADDDAYDRLPAPVKALYSREEWLWLPDQDKVTLVTRECEPEIFEN
jgi:hypothetical protein